MRQSDRSPAGETNALYTAAEKDANRFNLKCLLLLCSLALLSVVLNELGLFVISRNMMLPTMILAFLLMMIPPVIWLVHDGLLRREQSLTEQAFFKHLILGCAYAGIGLLCVVLSFHTVILLAVPPLMAAQYREQKSIFWGMVAVSILLVPVSVYGGYFFGTEDKNLLDGALTEQEAAVLSNRLAVATPKRMIELLLHYVIPRIFCVIAIIALVSGITRRNAKMLARQTELARRIREEMERRNAIQGRVIDELAALIENRDEGTGEHVARTKRYVRMISREMQQDEAYRDQLTDEVLARIESAAPLHDIGKIAVSDTILLKPGKLTAEEFDKMKVHAAKGGSMIQNIFSGMGDSAFLKTAEEIAASHHEKWDGSGYPNGLKGEQIPLPARIMAVADVYDALVSTRVYKAPIPPEEALDVIFSESGSHFDPGVIRSVRKIRAELIAAARSPADEIR